MWGLFPYYRTNPHPHQRRSLEVDRVQGCNRPVPMFYSNTNNQKLNYIPSATSRNFVTNGSPRSHGLSQVAAYQLENNMGNAWQDLLNNHGYGRGPYPGWCLKLCQLGTWDIDAITSLHISPNPRPYHPPLDKTHARDNNRGCHCADPTHATGGTIIFPTATTSPG